MAALVQDGDALILTLKVRPSARRDGWRGRLGEALKVDVAAAPEDGRANRQLIVFIAKSFAVPRADVELLSGANSRQKRVRITGAWRLPAELGDAAGA